MSREPAEPLPGWLSLAIHVFSLEGIRPWEFENAPADSWTSTVQYRNAWAAGVQDAQDEAEMNRRVAQMGDGGPAA